MIWSSQAWTRTGVAHWSQSDSRLTWIESVSREWITSSSSWNKSTSRRFSSFTWVRSVAWPTTSRQLGVGGGSSDSEQGDCKTKWSRFMVQFHSLENYITTNRAMYVCLIWRVKKDKFMKKDKFIRNDLRTMHNRETEGLVVVRIRRQSPWLLSFQKESRLSFSVPPSSFLLWSTDHRCHQSISGLNLIDHPKNLKSCLLNRIIMSLCHWAVLCDSQWYYSSSYRPPDKILSS